MHLRLVQVDAAQPTPQPLPRPAKVVQLEARRQARLEELRPKLPHERPAA